MADRAVVFIDGNNWYHSLRSSGVAAPGQLDYARISRKLLGPRSWVGTRYYVGQVRQQGDLTLYANQRRFLAALTAADARITWHLGRLEHRHIPNPAAQELLAYLTSLPVRIDREVYGALRSIAVRHARPEIIIEKAVDVLLAVDLVVMAERDAYDTAYLLSADGDFTPAVMAVRSTGKRVHAVSLSGAAELARAANTFIRLRPDWFTDCYR